MRRFRLIGVVALTGWAVFSGAGAGAQELGPPPEEDAASPGGFHGFTNFQTHAQGHVASLVGYLNAFREENRIGGALSEINGPTANSRNISGLYQRGEGAKFVYGVIGGGGGERGTLPDPPPGEVGAYYPTDPPEDTWQGPLTAANRFQTIDGRAYAKATEIPTGEAEAAFSKIDVPGYFTAEAAGATSATMPVPGGVEAKAVSVLRGVTAGPLRIESLTSRAYAYLPASAEDPVGSASTVIEGVTVNEIPVQITDQGVVVAENSSPAAQEEVNAALVEAGFKEVRLLPAKAVPGDDRQSVSTSTGSLSFVHYDEEFGASNPQGFSGGGFTIGVAEAVVSGTRCAPDCPGASGSGAGPGIGVDEGIGAAGGEEPDEPEAQAGAGQELPAGPDPSPGAPGPPSVASSAPPEPDLSAVPGFFVPPVLPSGGGESTFDFGGSSGSSSTEAFTPYDPGSAGAGGSYAAPAPAAELPVGGQGTPSEEVREMLPILALDQGSADWMRDLYLAVIGGAMVVLVCERVVRAR